MPTQHPRQLEAPHNAASPPGPTHPDGPDAPGLPELPHLPDLPNLPELPDLPDLPELPDLPDLPNLPELPDPELPELPIDDDAEKSDDDAAAATPARRCDSRLSDVMTGQLRPTERCAACGANFVCGHAAGLPACWCATQPLLPARLIVPGQRCLCPACLALRRNGELARVGL